MFLLEKNMFIKNNILNHNYTKISSDILRANFKNNYRSSKYVENTKNDLSFLVFQDLQLKNYLKYFFKYHGILLNDCYVLRTSSTVKIFVSYFCTLQTIRLIKHVNNSVLNMKFILEFIKLKSSYYNIRTKRFKIRYLIITKLKTIIYKFLYMKKQVLIFSSFTNKLLTSVNKYYKNNLKVNIVFQNLNKSLSFYLTNSDKHSIIKNISKLKLYSNTIFFKECINIILISLKKFNDINLLINFIKLKMTYMKKHNFFLNFLKRIFYLFIYSNISNILGIKLKIKGRFNGSLRSKTRIIKLGNISLQSFQSDLLYKNDTIFTKYGTIGIKIWIIKNINVTST